MKNPLSIILLTLLIVSWLWFWSTGPQLKTVMGEGASGPDTIRVWVDELTGSPEESFYYELEDLWNSLDDQVHLKLTVMAHAGYESKLRIALASGQPPDVCIGGLETLESLQYSGKAADLAVPIPEKFFPKERLAAMGPVVSRIILRDGRPTVFPLYRYAYGGVLLVNRRMLAEAGFEDEKIRREGWTFEEFREACRRMTRDTNGDGKPDVWGFGAALVHFNHLFLNEFGPSVWGKEVQRKTLFAFDDQAGCWRVHPGLSEEMVLAVFRLFNQLINEDKTWNPACLAMNWNEINDELILHHRLGMTFGETPWVARLRRDIWDLEAKQGLHPGQEPPDLAVVWMPTAERGGRPVPRAGVMGFNVLKQTPCLGDAHTENSIRAALYLTHPVHLVRSQLRSFRHLPPEPERFGKMFPELIDNSDPWVKFYNEIIDSDVPMAEPPLSESTPGLQEYRQLRLEFERWMERKGVGYLQETIYQKISPEEGARQFFQELEDLPRRTAQRERTD
jgi:ABC-type glycerol-3-phosphate transport system substrate-binding protein